MPPNGNVVRIAAVADLHCAKAMAAGTFQPLFSQVAERAHVLALAGDLTDYGLPEEARLLVRELAVAKVPVVAVFGNHDYESERHEDVKQILTEGGVTVLDGDSVEIHGVGFAGVKGFAGGFGARALQSWGEPILKRFVREAVEEALKLEGALARLDSCPRIAVLHYSPIRETVASEPAEVVPFLGSSRLEEPINRYGAVVAFHGHAHHGAPEGRTSTGVPVYNVSMPLLRALRPDQPPFRIVEIPIAQEAAVPAATTP